MLYLLLRVVGSLLFVVVCCCLSLRVVAWIAWRSLLLFVFVFVACRRLNVFVVGCWLALFVVVRCRSSLCFVALSFVVLFVV